MEIWETIDLVEQSQVLWQGARMLFYYKHLKLIVGFRAMRRYGRLLLMFTAWVQRALAAMTVAGGGAVKAMLLCSAVMAWDHEM